jgi:3-hydroxy-9,10-secoandrosta-1,3,5(10)-triene-9,17-dione monooxygenase reductase component
MVEAGTTFNSRTFRHVLGHFATGVAVITADGPAGPAGLVVSSFTSVSLEPPLVAFLPGKASTSWPEIQAAGAFCVNILNVDQQEVCAKFARKDGDKFAGISWRAAPSGAPILDGVMAWIDCELTQTFESGDHYIAIGRVQQLEATEFGAAPLVFFQGGYQQLEGPVGAATPAGRGAPRTFAGMTSEELANRTGTDVDTLLRYATSATELVDEIVGSYVRDFHQTCRDIAEQAPSAQAAIESLLRETFGSMERNRVAIMILQNERPFLSTRPEFAYLDALESEIESVWHAILHRGAEGGEFRDGLDVTLTYRFIRDVLFSAARTFSSRDWPSDEAERRSDTYRSLILRGLCR